MEPMDFYHCKKCGAIVTVVVAFSIVRTHDIIPDTVPKCTVNDKTKVEESENVRNFLAKLPRKKPQG